MFKTKKIFILGIFSGFLLVNLFPLITYAKAGNFPLTFEEKIMLGIAKNVNINDLKSDNNCCFLLQYEGQIIDKVECLDQSAIKNNPTCFGEADERVRTMPIWGKCGIDNMEAYDTLNTSYLKQAAVMTSLKKFKSDGGKCLQQISNQVSRATLPADDMCCYCATMTKRAYTGFIAGIYDKGCYHKNIIPDTLTCENQCNRLDPNSDFGTSSSPNWAWVKCGIDSAEIIKIYEGRLNSAVKIFEQDSSAWLKYDYCYYSTTKNEVGLFFKPLHLKLNVPIPGLEEFSTPEGAVVDNQTISRYLGVLYKFLVGIASLLAVIMIAYAGFLWLFASGAGEKVTKAKEIIMAAISGLVLILGSYLLLNFINPALVNLDFPTSPTEIVPVIKSDNSGSVPVTSDDFDNKIIFLSDINDVIHKRLAQETIDKLKSARLLLGSEIPSELKTAGLSSVSNEQLQINSAFRTLAEQTEIYNKYGSGRAAIPGTSPHESGMAVDICLRGTFNGKTIDSCGYLNPKCNRKLGDKTPCKIFETDSNGTELTDKPPLRISSPDLDLVQNRLQTIMATAGFARYCKEWWHFEAPPKSKSLCKPGNYD